MQTGESGRTPENLPYTSSSLVLERWRHLELPPCHEPLYARGGHLQTLAGFFLPSPLFEGQTEEFFLTLEDGDTLHGRLAESTAPLVVYLFHGLGGSIESTYIQRTARLAHALGATVIMGNHRGSGAGRDLATRPYHSGSAHDLSVFIREGRRRYPEHRHLAIGFSLSANATLLLAAGFQAEVLPDAVIAVNAPVDLRTSARELLVGLNKIYDWNFMRDMRRIVKGRRIEGQPVELRGVRTMYDFDQAYTARAAGFKDRDDYYDSCSATKFGTRIKVPAFVIMSENDPFIPIRTYQRMSFSSQTIVHIEKSGGHLGYLTNHVLAADQKRYGHRWLDYALHRLVKEAVKP